MSAHGATLTCRVLAPRQQAARRDGGARRLQRCSSAAAVPAAAHVGSVAATGPPAPDRWVGGAVIARAHVCMQSVGLVAVLQHCGRGCYFCADACWGVGVRYILAAASALQSYVLSALCEMRSARITPRMPCSRHWRTTPWPSWRTLHTAQRQPQLAAPRPTALSSRDMTTSPPRHHTRLRSSSSKRHGRRRYSRRRAGSGCCRGSRLRT